jgi:perosamine synthetase
MKNEKLALFGGPKVIRKNFKRYNSIGKEEISAVNKVMKTGILSDYIANNSDHFYGGKKVRQFEKMCEKYFNVKRAISVNSWTSGLIAAVGALDINPGDEIIVSPWTMCATATAIIHWNAIPVFADIENKTFNLNPKEVEKKITKRTKAIMSVDIFGHPGPMNELKKIAKKYKLKIISDSAQSPAAMYKNKYAGTMVDIGGISLNCHKHIQTGEGGVLFTNDIKLAERMCLIRNHAEAIVKGKSSNDLSNMIGYNFRLGEIECAIGIEQLKKLKPIINSRRKIAKKLNKELKDLVGLRTPIVKNECTHSYYAYPMVIDTKMLGVSKQKIYKALIAEGAQGLQIHFTNVHRLPMFINKIAYGNKNFPWTQTKNSKKIKYGKGTCPVAEDLLDNTYIGFGMFAYEYTKSDIDLIIKSFKKVWSNLHTLK